MGWCSGTEIFDKLVSGYLSETLHTGVLRRMIRNLVISLENQDWDCQSDSSYYNHPDVKSVFKELHPSWFEDEEKDYRMLLDTLRNKFTEIENEINDSGIKQGDLDNIKYFANDAKEMISDILGNL